MIRILDIIYTTVSALFVFDIFGSIWTITSIVSVTIGIVGSYIAIESKIKQRKNEQIKLEEMLINRKSFVETSIVKINNEFEPVTFCKTKNYVFKANGYTISLKTGESLIIPHPLPDGFDYLLFFGWGCAWKNKIIMGDIKANKQLGEFIFINSEQNPVKKIKIVQPGWKDCNRNIQCNKCENPECIKLLDANPDPICGGDPTTEEIRKKGIKGKIKSYYENIHTHWIDLNIYVMALGIPPEARYIKISLEKQNPDLTDISLNIAEIIPATKEEYSEMEKKKAFDEEKQSPNINNNEDIKKFLEIYRKLRIEKKLTELDNLWKSVDQYIEKNIYMASKLLKYALSYEDHLNEEIFQKVMKKLDEKVEKEKDVQSCCLLAHLYGFNSKFDPKHKEDYEKKALEYTVRAGDMIEEYEAMDKDEFDKLMNLQWRCYESAARKYDHLSDHQKELDMRDKLNRVFERITKKHPFASPIMDNVFENFNETMKIKKI